MSEPEKTNAIAYCESIGSDPFEEVWCHFEGNRTLVVRWLLYVGAVVEGATDER